MCQLDAIVEVVSLGYVSGILHGARATLSNYWCGCRHRSPACDGGGDLRPP
jgi:hypothetical protein